MKNNEEIDTSEKNYDGVRSGDVSLCVCADFIFILTATFFKNSRRAFKYSHKKESIQRLLLLERTHQ
jgi:hypothetical protein